MKRRFETEQQILNAIDRNQKCIQRGIEKIVRLEHESKDHFKESWEHRENGRQREAGKSAERGNKCLETAKKSRRHIIRLESKSKTLGERLSEFRTRPCFSMLGQLGIGDMSVKAV